MADTTFSLPLSHVEGEHGTQVIGESLNAIKGIKRHRIEHDRAVITTDDVEDVLPEAVVAIRKQGYHVDTVRKTFPVTGMSCASCAASVESMLKALPGVVTAGVNYANGTASVEYVPGIGNLADFKAAIQSIGYDLVIDDGEEAAETLEAQKEQYVRDLRRKAVLSLGFSIPLAVIGMFFMHMPYASYIMWALATPVVLVFGRRFYTNAWRQLQNRSATMDTLVALSTGIAYLFSVFNTVYPDFWHARGLHAHVYFEAAAVVIAFVLLGRLLEERAKGSTSSAIRKLMGLQPKTVTVVHGEEHQMDIPIAQVQVGDTILVKPGEKIAIDGEVIEGHSFVDESTLSGEPIAVRKMAGSKVFSGTINQKGSFQFRAEKVGKDTVLSGIIRAVQEAQGSKAPVQKLVDKIAAIFVPVVISIAILSLISWTVFGGENGVSQGVLAMVTVLIIACPCALGLATPTAIMVGVGKGAEAGILIKDAESMERAYKVDSIAFDKTGTITEGKPEVNGIIWNEGLDQMKLSSVLYGIEARSEHPFAIAVSKHFEQSGVARVEVDDFLSSIGKGVFAGYAGTTYFIGSERYLAAKSIKIPDSMQLQADKWYAAAHTVVWFTDGKIALAAISISDKIKAQSKAAISHLHELGITTYMLTGDTTKTAQAVAAQVGIDEYRSEMMPDSKAGFIKHLQQRGHVVAMVGDGINDSLALAQADVSIAMGKGTDIAMDVAKMTLISSDLRSIPSAIALSRSTVGIIRQNLFWASIYNVMGIPIAAGILYPVNGFLLNPMIAGAAMALSSISVVTNSLRLKWSRL